MKSIGRHWSALLLAIALSTALVLQGCESRGGEAETALATDLTDASVEELRGNSGGNEEARALRPNLRLGKEDSSLGQNSEHLLYRPKAVVIDGQARAFVLDNDNGRIAVYSTQGRFLRSIGRSGSGPGEFGGSPNVLDDLALGGDLLAALETPTRRIQIFDTDGTYVSSFAKHLGSSSIAISGQRVYTSTAGREGKDARIEVFSLRGDLIGEFGESAVGEANSPRAARRDNRSLIAVAGATGEVGRVYQYVPIFRVYHADGSLRRETVIEGREQPQSVQQVPGVSLSERTVRTLVAEDIEYVESLDLWVILLAGGVVRAYSGQLLEPVGEFHLLRPAEDPEFAEEPPSAAALDIGLSPAGDLVCATVAQQHEVWCYELEWGR